MSVLMQTLFPDPVAPAIRRCGIRSSEVAKGTPATSFPSARGSASRESWNAAEEMISRSETVAFMRFGISIPTAALPGMGATIRIRCAFSASARSSCRFRI